MNRPSKAAKLSGNVKKRSSTNHAKVLVMILFLLVDLGLNGTLDYDILNDRRADNVLLGLFGLQAVIQVSIFLVLFLAATETYLFQVGLLGILIRSISTVLILQPIYGIFTIAAGAYRVQRLSGSDTLNDLWQDDTFIALSTLQKIVAVPYYFANIRTTIMLEDPMYFQKEPWIMLIKQQKRVFDSEARIAGR